VPYNVGRRTVLARGLKLARQQAGLSAKTAAEKLTASGVSCTRGTLLAWERGGGRTSREPFASDLWLISQAYGCSVNELFSRGAAEATGDEIATSSTEAPAAEPESDGSPLVA
jgi:transcriptional regulator with XRE-family HTH domain